MNEPSPELVALVRHCYEEGFTPANRGILADWLEEHGGERLREDVASEAWACRQALCSSCVGQLTWLLKRQKFCDSQFRVIVAGGRCCSLASSASSHL